MASKRASGSDVPSVAMSTLQAYVKKLPSPKKSGNALIDTDTDAKCQMMRDIITECMTDMECIAFLYAQLRERQRKQAEGEGDATFKDVRQFKNLDADFLVNFAAKRSDMTVDEIVSCIPQDAEAPQQLVAFATQLPLTLRWPAALRSQELTYRFLQARANDMGDRIKDFKKRGGLLSNNGFNWTKGCYQLAFGETGGKLVSITHCLGDKVAIGDEVHIFKTTCSLIENWSDMSAAILQPPYPPLKLATFETPPSGPYRFRHITKTCPDLDRMVKVCADELEADRRRVASSVGAGSVAAAKIEELTKEKNAERCAKARLKAAEALSAKKARKMIKLS